VDVSIGELSVKGCDAIIADSDIELPLLGPSFLKQVKLEVRGEFGILVLRDPSNRWTLGGLSASVLPLAFRLSIGIVASFATSLSAMMTMNAQYRDAAAAGYQGSK
jgi:hypothetical protein